MRFISARLASQGFVNRRHLMEKFGISVAQASMDLNSFLTVNPCAMVYNKTSKRYEARK